MAARKSRSRTLTIFLIKNRLSPSDVIQDPDSLTKVPVAHGSRSIGNLYVRTPRSARPHWLSLFDGYADLSIFRLRNASTSAVLLTRRANRLFAITFGYGRYLLVPGSWEENFGLKTTLNMLDPTTIRSIDRKRFDALTRQTREQASRASSIDNFGLDIEQDLLRALVGKPKDTSLGRRVAGMDALAPTVDIELPELPELLIRYAKEYRRLAYQKTFPWVDHIAEVRDPRLREDLEAQLLDRLDEERPERCWLAVPEPLKWATVAGFRYGRSRREDLKPDLYLQDFRSTIRRDVDLSADYLRRRKVYCIGTEGDQTIARWRVFDCLYAEIDLRGDTFLLSNGSWYRVARRFVDAVNTYVRNLPETRIVLPDYKDDSETAYNKRAVKEHPKELALMDRKTIAYGGGPSRIEFCDIYSRSRAMIHVKHYHGSNVLSHLFSQGLVSAQTFLRSSEFRKAVNQKLPASHAFANAEKRPRTNSFEVAYAIISRSAKPLNLPFFSKVNLRHAAEQLRTLGFRVTLTKISVDQ